MIEHDGAIGTQCSGYADFWAAHRDAAGPVTPADVWGLREDREFEPPSRAHFKRIKRFRPVVTLAQPVVLDTFVRSELNRRVAASKEVLAACGCTPRVLEVGPKEVVEATQYDLVRQPGSYAEQRLAEAARLASYGMIAVGRLPHMHDALVVNKQFIGASK